MLKSEFIYGKLQRELKLRILLTAQEHKKSKDATSNFLLKRIAEKPRSIQLKHKEI